MTFSSSTTTRAHLAKSRRTSLVATWLKNLIPASFRSLPGRRRSGASSFRPAFENLEGRLTPSADVLTFHNDFTNTGQNLNETALSPANVHVGAFGKIATTLVDGQIYTQPLVVSGLEITGGPRPGVHDVVFAATENDSLYAIDAAGQNGGATGSVLWKRSFTDVTNPSNNTLGAAAIAAVPWEDTNSGDINPVIGITGTPVIDRSTNTLYLVAKTKETISGVAHYVQRLHAINIADGSDRAAPFLIGDTINRGGGDYTNNTPIYSYGTGDGNAIDAYNGTGQSVVAFNALREHQRAALKLVNGMVYVDWASHSDNGPYHGWVAAWDVRDLSGQGLKLAGVLNTSPNDGEAGIWQGSGALAFEADGSAFYFMTGNGTGGLPKVGADGFPIDGNYNEAVVKVVADPTTNAVHQNANGWGMKVVDYFIPTNVEQLDGSDNDFGSGAPLLLPDSAGIPGHPHLLVVGGKEGKLYVLDRDNLGKFDPNVEHVVSSNGRVKGLLSTPAWYNGSLYVVSGYAGNAYQFVVSADGSLTATSQTAVNDFGNLTGSPIISANGNAGGIVWIPDRTANVIRAYGASSLSTELWNTNQKPGGADRVGALTKFGAPTVANGRLFVGTLNSLVIYGLTPPANAVPDAPSNFKARALSRSAVQLSWQDTTTPPNTANGYAIEMSTDGINFTQVTTAPPGATALSIGGLEPLTTYSFRIHSFNGLGDSANSPIVQIATTNQVASLDFSSGFAGAGGAVIFNGTARINGSRAELTDGGPNESGSIFSSGAYDISRFTTQFSFQATNASADGFAFVIQGNGPTVIGNGGGGLGYAGLGRSVAVKFDLFSNNGEGNSSTGLYAGGADPTTPSIDLSAAGIDLHSGDIFQVSMSYDGVTLSVTITDTVTGVSATQNYTVDIPALVGGNDAYVGFTGGTGGTSAYQDILTWTFAPNAPEAPATPSALGATAASATSINLTWTNNAINQNGYLFDRATDPDFTQNLITETLPSAPSSFADAAIGLAPGGTYYYRLRAFNVAGDSGNSNVVGVSIPVAPPKPSDAHVVEVTATEIELNWTDNASHAAQGYKVLRAVNHGSFAVYGVLPYMNAPSPSTYDWTDTDVSPGTFYEYHILAYNVSGNNDFTGTNVSTVTLPPSVVVSTSGVGVIGLSWTAPDGAVSYNIYRGTSPGSEGAVPYATGVSAASFIDTKVVSGVTYYYTISAFDAGGESEKSAEVLAASAVNLAKGKAASASSSENGGTSATSAFDGNLRSRWSSQFTDNQWLQVDLGARYDIIQVTLDWENAYGRAYEIQVSIDGLQWNRIYSTANSHGGNEDLMGLSGVGRYVRMQGLQRATGYGYSLWEMAVYGTPNSGSQAPTVVSPAKVSSITGMTAALSVLGADAGGEAGLTYTWSVSAAPAGAAPVTFSGNGTNAAKNTTATFAQPGVYVLLATLRDSAGLTATSSVTVSVYGANLALNKVALAKSSENAGTAPSNAFDGNANTRWSSQFNNDQWLQVDLGASYTISRVTLNWEAAYGKAYEIQTSMDGDSWKKIYETATGHGGIEDLSVSGTGRYVRMHGIERATGYGYSLWEMAVYGNLAPTVVKPASLAPNTATTATLSVLGADDAGEQGLTYTWSVLAAPAGATPATFSVNGSNAAKNTVATFVQPGDYTLLATIQDAAGATVTSRVAVSVLGNNLALGKPATASSIENGGAAAGNAFDGNSHSRWSSQFSDDQWLQVDLGARYSISQVTMNWEDAYGKSYEIQVSDDGVHWTSIYGTHDGHGGVETLTGLSGTGRYVRMQGIERATQYGYSLWEMAVYGTPLGG